MSGIKGGDKILECSSCGNTSDYYYSETKSFVMFYLCRECDKYYCNNCVKKGGLFSSDKCPDCDGKAVGMGYGGHY